MIIALTGVTGNMGREVLKEVYKIEEVEKIRVLVLPDDDKRFKKIRKNYDDKIEVVYGTIANKNVCKKLVEGTSYVVNMAAVIPPHSDKFPEKAVECNEVGATSLTEAIEEEENQPKLIHISTVALYGNRNSLHPWARVGDPFLVSPFDIYSATKLRGEFRVLESDVKNFAVLRQTAMLHNNMLFDNMSDGLMFHTCFNAPLEWVTANDSGVLIANILKRDIKGEIDDFWNKCYNIGGGKLNCVTGYDTLNDGFELIGGSTKDFFDPNYNSLRNFHGVWFYDGNVLEDLFHYQRQSTKDFWKELGENHSYFKLAKIVEKKVIKKLAIERLLKDKNAPTYWVNNNDEARIIAYFGGKDKYDNIPKNWADFPLLIENKDENGEKIDFLALKNKENAKLLNHGYDENEEVTIETLREVARAHGGLLLSKEFNGMYEKLQWANSDGETFTARPYTVLKAGHWFNRTYKENVWDFDRLSKIDSIYKQLWLDSHGEDENYLYIYDENFNAKVEKQ